MTKEEFKEVVDGINKEFDNEPYCKFCDLGELLKRVNNAVPISFSSE